MTEALLSLKQRFNPSRFFRGEDPVAGPITLNQRRIFILPTGQGLLFAALIVLVLLIAFVYNNNLAYLLSFLLASIFFVTILHSYKSLAGLVIQAGYNQPAFAGAAAGFNFHVHDPSGQLRVGLDIRLREGQTSLAPRQTQTVTLYVSAERRGWLSCDILTISSRYPLGLFRAWSPLRFDSRVLIYPMPAREMRPFPETDAEYGQQGQNRRNGDEFLGLKTYQTGDSIRQIHWKSFAKGRGLHSKQYAGAGSVDLWLDYAAAPGSNVEERLSQMCRWVVEAERLGLAYGLMLPGIRIEPNVGADHYHQCLEILAQF
ncbi:DUF58 domain-containing protein [Methylomonas sp. LL1]|uniref:DUF58 domain-containing protein n=1 Tax=Methylomonas sp. LL1 TaxID=2785785 RepID=UPI0018C425E1|nr:DUF58 domain-containing protein [Methylomonas sp. LL1]QPK62579.1 DUF58 domain-containing protein [Methylomonas sp. LL1]